MSDKFCKIARQEIESEINSLQEIFRVCMTDQQFYDRAKEIERHLHKIKGLAPMMGQEEVGKIAKLSNLVTRYVLDHGVLNGSHDVITDSIQSMYQVFNDKTNSRIEDFEKQVKKILPPSFRY
jgi:HPt (histidine-containing phosphotransfer) domain-containing protein